MKNVIFLISFLTSFVSLFASSKDSDLIVKFVDGTNVVYSLSEKPNITFSDEEMYISLTNQVVSYNIKNIDNFTYQPSANSLQDVLISYRIDKVSTDGLQISGLNGTNSIVVYDVNGNLVYSITSNDDTINIPLNHKNSNIVLVRINNNTLKINLK